MLIDDFAAPKFLSPLGTTWRAVSDKVMGGVSEPVLTRYTVDGRNGLRLSGDVRLENNGGFIQASLDLAESGGTLDASSFEGICIVARGNRERYGVHLRTPDCTRPWQSYRAEFIAGPAWQSIDLPFSTFVPHRLDPAMDVTQLRRIGLAAIGRAFHADLTVARLAFYPSSTS